MWRELFFRWLIEIHPCVYSYRITERLTSKGKTYPSFNNSYILRQKLPLKLVVSVYIKHLMGLHVKVSCILKLFEWFCPGITVYFMLWMSTLMKSTISTPFRFVKGCLSIITGETTIVHDFSLNKQIKFGDLKVKYQIVVGI